MKRTNKRSGRGGFTLIEVAAATAIVGIALTALLVAVGSNTRVNDAGSKLTEGSFLAQEIREWTLSLPFRDLDPGDADKPPGPDGTSPQVFVDDLDDLMGVTFSPPRDGRGYAMYDYQGWSQTLSMSWRDPNDVAVQVSPGASDMICVQVTVSYQGRAITSANWLVAGRQED
ncbi:MAG TPA: prepilin-type N-terminal cleavage/methylation domain-containing protein [Phycisphaerae bacterium]|nr:prepilin-type N-terminal cleavage/methylation domain-containing protein [Phycisphaerae bacterium]